MTRSLLQVAAAVLLGLILVRFGFRWSLRLVAVVLGLVCVHWLWQRFVFRPYDYLGTMPVEPGDPIMTQAVRRAKETFDEFRKLYPAHQEGSMVKFSFQTDQGVTENLWGDLMELGVAYARVYARTLPVEHHGGFDRQMEIPVQTIVDWMIELPDGTLRGGFTNQALFKIFERQEGCMHPKFESHMRRFQDGLAPPDDA
jgi:uncharacterized protein YegJ (DUF2314 family)